MAPTRTRPLTMRVSEQSFAEFEDMRREAGLSQSGMFERVMAEQAQRRRLEHDIEILGRNQPDETVASVARWQSTHPLGLGE